MKSNVKILSIGTDRKLFEKGSAVRARAAEYGGLFGELHVVVFAKRSLGLKPEKIADNVWIYPTGSATRAHYVTDAISKGAEIMKAGGEWAITTQDPFECGLAGLGLKRRTGARLVVQAHTDFLSKEFRYGSILNPIRLAVARIVVPNADRLRVVSGRIAESAAGRYGLPRERVSVLPIFVDAAASEGAVPERKPFPFTVLMASRLTKEKNILLALDAVAGVVLKHPEAGLVIVGEGPERAVLERKARESGISANVAFMPWTNSLSGWYKAADAFLLTSLYEGYGMTLVEAAAAGCPIATTDVGVARELIRDGEDSFVCPVGDAGCLTAALSTLLENPDKRRAFSEKMRQKAAELTGTKEAYLDAYAKLFEPAR